MSKKKQTKQPKQMKVKAKGKKNIKKRFFEVKVPLTATKVHLYSGSAEELEGSIIKIDLTRSLRGKSLELIFKVVSEGDELKGIPKKAHLMQGYIRRAVRRGTDYVEDSFDAECRDLKVKIKPFLITRKKVSRAVRNSLRVTAKKFLEGYLKTRDAEEIFSEILANKLQKTLSLKLKKVYPLAMCDIRVFEVLGEHDKEIVYEEDAVEEAEKEEEVPGEKEEVKEEKPKKKAARKKAAKKEKK